MMVILVESGRWRYFSVFPRILLKSTRDGALTAATVRVRTFGHLQVARFPTNLGLVDRWLG